MDFVSSDSAASRWGMFYRRNVSEFITTSFGADPELFAVDNNYSVVPLIGKLGGTKDNPTRLPDAPGHVQEDNVAGEFNTDVAFTKEEFVNNVLSVRNSLYQKIKDVGLRPYVKSSVLVNMRELEKYPEAMVFGCVPDYNIWTGKKNPEPKASDPRLRTGAGHVHFGYTNTGLMHIMEYKNTHLYLLRKTVILSDLLIGVPTVLLDKDTARRELYGKAGCYRFKHNRKQVIIEYRTPGNFWVRNSNYVKWMADQMDLILNAYPTLQEIREGLKVDPKLIQDCINNCDKDAAKYIVDTHGITMPKGYKHG